MNNEKSDDAIEDDGNDEFTDFLRDAIGVILRSEDPGELMGWMRQEAIEGLPGLFAELPDDEARLSAVSELGRAIWNAVPLPGNGFRPRPLPQPERNEPCPCGSGRKYKKCCAAWSDAPSLDVDGIWLLLVEQLSLEQAEELGKAGRVPRHFVGELAAALLGEGEALRALALVEPLFERPERLDERDAVALDALLQAYEDLELEVERQEAVERLARQLKPPLRAALWENLVRSHAVRGEIAEAWEALEKARKDEPVSASLGPLEVSLLLVEGRTQEAGERARYYKDRLRRDPEAVGEEGHAFLDQVARQPEEAQLELSLGEETAKRLLLLEGLLAVETPASRYEIVEIEGDPGAGRLQAPGSLEPVVQSWDEVFFSGNGFEVDDPDDDDLDEDWDEEDAEDDWEDAGDEDPEGFEDEDGEEDDDDPWEEERAESWLGFLLDQPAALGSLEILAELAGALDGRVRQDLGFLDRRLLRPVLDRGLSILRQALETRPELSRLPETAEPNGSVLALIEIAAEQAERLGEPERAQELMDWVDRLDPHPEDEDLF